MTSEQTFSTETYKEKRTHRIKLVNDTLEPSVIYVDNHFQFPNKLLKYYECNENNINALKEEYLWASDPNSFNDIIDCSVALWEKESFTWKTMNALLPANFVNDIKGDSTLENRNRFIEFYIKKMGIICLNSGENKELLWGYYNQNNGFCIEFNPIRLTAALEVSPIKLEYCNKLAEEKLDFDKLFYPKMVRWASIKKEKWEIEDEWRYIFINTITNRKKKYSKGSINKIILGYHFFNDFQLIENNKPVHVFRAKYSTNRFKIKLLNHLKDIKSDTVYCVQLNDHTLKLENVPISIQSKTCRNYKVEIQLT